MSRTTYDWEAVVDECRRRPSVWLPMFPDHPAQLAKNIHNRRSGKLRRDDGYLEARLINKYQVPGFPPRGDVWVRWVSTTNEIYISPKGASMVTKKIRDVTLDPETRTRLENKAFIERTTLSNLVRGLIGEILAGKHENLKPQERPVGHARIGLEVDDQTWEALGELAWRQRTTRSRLIRDVAAYRYRKVPLEREEVTR